LNDDEENHADPVSAPLLMTVVLRAACPDDYGFARGIYYETMRWLIECLFGWDEARQDAKFAEQFKLDEVRIITVDGRDAGWLQTPTLQRQGIGTEVMKRLLVEARSERKAVTLAVVKINPARCFFERHGFRMTREDEYKIYMTLV